MRRNNWHINSLEFAKQVLRKSIPLFLLIFAFLVPVAGFAQEEQPETKQPQKKKKAKQEEELGAILKILQVNCFDSLENVLEMKISAHQNGIPLDSQQVERTIRLVEYNRDEPDTLAFNDLLFRRDSLDNKSPVSVWVMLDISGSMRTRIQGSNRKIDFAKQQIVQTVRKNRLPIGSTYISSFDETVSTPLKLDTNRLDQVSIPPSGKGRYTHLYECLWGMLDTMATDSSPEKVLILVADGENDLRPGSDTLITRDSLVKRLAALDTTFRIYPVAIGNEIDSSTLAQLIDSTHNGRDTFVYNVAPTVPIQLGPQLPWTHSLIFSSTTVPHSGRNRMLKLEVSGLQDSTFYHLGSVINPIGERTDWTSVGLAAILIATIVLLLFAALVPQIRWWDFKRKYVRRYWEVKTPGVVKYDPLTKAPFHDKDQVVIKCEHMTSLPTWKFESEGGKMRYHCIHYPNKCEEGEGHTKSKNFFSQKGFYRGLNWIWFGGLGGLIGWALWALWENYRPQWQYLEKVKEISGHKFLMGLSSLPKPLWQWYDMREHIFERLAAPILDEFAFGVLFGSALIFALSWVKERGQGKLDSSWLRILFRSLLGIIISILVFAIGALSKLYVWPGHRFWPGLLSYALLGLAACLILTIAGRKLRLKGFLFGALAGILGYSIYVFLFTGLFNTIDFEWAKMGAFFILGGLMGFLIMMGVALLEDFGVEFLQPEWYNQKVNVSRWLKEGGTISIGRGSKDKLRIKKDKKVMEGHAKLTLKNDRVYIIPNGEVTINEKAIPKGKKRPLRHLDRIGFGEKSYTKLRYLERRTGDA